MSGKPDTNDLRLAEQAAQWYGALKERPEADGAALFNWLAESPRHVDEMLSTLVLAQEIAELTPQQLARIERTAAGVGEPDPYPANVVPLADKHSGAVEAGSRGQRRWKTIGGIAAGLAVAAGGWWFLTTARGQTYETAIGEQRVLELADGSIIHLNTQSRLNVRYGSDTRSLELVSGQALFKVAKDTRRPFVVQSGTTTIRALGTEFDVYRRDVETRVAVLEGSVQVSEAGTPAAPKVSAGERIEVTAGSEPGPRQSVNVEQTIAWRQRRLIFQEDTLGHIAAEFNRYNKALKIRVIGEAATSQHFSGTFDADAPETLMQALAGDETLRVEHRGQEIVIRER